MQVFFEQVFKRLAQIETVKKDKKIREIIGLTISLMEPDSFLEKFFFLRKYPQMRIYK